MRNFALKLSVLLLIFLCVCSSSSRSRVEAKCKKGCDLALASYYLWRGVNLTFISKMFDTSIETIQSFNPQITDRDKILAGTRISVPFTCNCIQKQFLGHNFSYLVKSGNTYRKIAELIYANLTTVDWLRNSNIYDEDHLPDVGSMINVIVNCSCGEKSVSKDYGLFVTYPLRPGENLSGVVDESEIPSDLLQKYNPTSDFSSGSGLIFFPGRDQSGNYPPLKIGTGGISSRVIAGISVGGVVGALLLAFCLYTGLYRRKKVTSFFAEASDEPYIQHGSGNTLEKTSEPAALVASTRFTGITVEKSVEFSYEELAKATDNFSTANKIGQGGFASVFFAELRGEKAAIKKMDMQASKEFLAELKVLTHVHHLNLVRLIGYCVEGSLFLVYEYIENGNLNQHLRGLGKDPLPWSARMQIALDSARGLEYIHEHTVPVYIHRDIKSANILIDKNFRAKVADFGLTKLTEFDSASVHTRLVGTFGYMPPEYAQYGEVSPKIDVYAFGVVLCELISAKEAVVKTNETITESTGLVALFEDILHQPDPREDLRKLVDPRLGDNYPFDSVRKMAQLARACTQENPQLRPSMRAIVVALMTLSSSTEDWDVGSFYENQGPVNLMSGR
ncbi:putative Receptor protein kinase [Melia azedarach]|uniref:Receptor protein kinase n=1 Tax=Melia azedarach TaxID=155640 RepID=A0ACC1WXQ4_MELAZ|nr:putative Receptor protein kinase [Melia azedarach]